MNDKQREADARIDLEIAEGRARIMAGLDKLSQEIQEARAELAAMGNEPRPTENHA